MSDPDPTPVVSVRIICYNQRDYIAQAVESALNQQTEFPYEIVIGDDCSTDGTAEVVRGYAARFPAKVRVLARERHLGRQANFLETVSHCRGEFVALLDGDDYWTSPHKLQKQVDLLRANPDWSGCSHNGLIVDEKSGSSPRHRLDQGFPAVLRVEDLLEGDPLLTATLMFRRTAIESLPDWLASAPVADYFLKLIALQRGGIGYIDEVLCVYRVHPGGDWQRQTASAADRRAVEIYALARRRLLRDRVHRRRTAVFVGRLCLRVAAEELRRGNRCSAARYALASIRWSRGANGVRRVILGFWIVARALLPGVSQPGPANRTP